MRRLRVGFAAAVTLLLATSVARAAEPAQPAATAQLPEALLAIPGAEHAVMPQQEAAKVRGQWTLQLSLPIFAAAIQGTGPFRLHLLTSSGGLTAPDPICICIRIGH